MVENNSRDTDRKTASGWLASGGLFTGLLSFVGASCCVLPIILVQAGISTTLVSRLGFFARYQSWFQIVTVLLLVAATFLAFRHGRPRRRVIVLLVAAFVLAAGAFILPSIEGDLLQWLDLRLPNSSRATQP